jgi:predicted phosphoadenosine phosphosulfate sulfurtransferase
MSDKVYLQKNVYEAFLDRLDYIFSEFDNIYVAFSGGKDSGLLLNLVMDYVQRNNISKRIGLFHQDMEAQYQKTTDYVTLMFEKYADQMEPYWFCQPIASRTAVGNYEMFWYPWDDEKPELWIRPMPTMPYVYSLQNNPFTLYKYKMDYNSHAKQFGRWYRDTHNGGKTICLLGLRADESLNRYSAIMNKRYDYKGKKWITSEFKDVWSASPFYDWTVYDVWTANAKFGYEYNKLYDLFYKAGVSLDNMRVASPFHEDAKNSLNLYRVLEPATWAKLVGRVQGANFAAIYGGTKALGYREVSLPPGHTWKSYTKFLLQTLPEEIRNNYIEKFKTSIIFWHKNGGGFAEDVIQEIEECGYDIRRNGISNYTKDGKSKIVFKGKIPDNTDDVKSTMDIPSWKRMAYCILKNDHLCKFMGFGMTKQQQERKKEIIAKYKNL